MNAILEYILGIIATLATSLFIWLLISLLFRYARVYATIGSRKLVGYLIKNKQGEFVFYSSLIPLIRRRKGVVIKQSDILLMKQNDEHNWAEMPSGCFNQSSQIVNDEFGTYVAIIEDIGKRASCAVVGDIEMAYSKGSIRSKKELTPFGAAVGALLKTEIENAKQTPDMRVGVGDLFLPAAIIFILLYNPLLLLFHNVNSLVFPLAMVGSYLFILLVLFLIKHSVTMGNGSFKWPVLIDDNVGMLLIDLLIIILGIVLHALLPIYASHLIKLLPAIGVLVFAVCANMFVFKRFRLISSPYERWTGPWRKPSYKPGNTKPSGMEERHFSWVNILALKGIVGDDKTDSFTIQLPHDDFEGVNPRVRAQNLFYNPTLQDEKDRDKFVKRVLEGADKVLSAIGEVDLYEDKALTQIVNSAYQVCKRYNLADFEMFDLILLFCQMNIEYREDKNCESINNIEEYYRFACETIYDRVGDCDCKSVLGYKLFELLGVNPKLVMVKVDGCEYYNHAALVLRNDSNALIQLPPQYKEYAPGQGVYCEATSDGSIHPGDIPKGVDLLSLQSIG